MNRLPYFCTICDIGFSFKSRHEKHLQSSRHQFLSNMKQPSLDEQSLTEVNLPEDTHLFNDDCFEEVCSTMEV